MTDEHGKQDSAGKFFIGDMAAELAHLKQRFGLSDPQLKQIETLMQWSYNSGVHSGPGYGRQLFFNDMSSAPLPQWF
ncbi:hypothetical protein [Cohnella zeiphila]|uniref:Uncharacterized protein n=1 Tax=Cohnella zeiphila TaxID=2761120 RepID=A0A7X0SVX0_9BACL|nr:hypothetical protein [Cohnella zeiphila]MBB6735915.1 hypothetical protein [Cohnella zeiphila]